MNPFPCDSLYQFTVPFIFNQLFKRNVDNADNFVVRRFDFVCFYIDHKFRARILLSGLLYSVLLFVLSFALYFFVDWISYSLLSYRL